MSFPQWRRTLAHCPVDVRCARDRPRVERPGVDKTRLKIVPQSQVDRLELDGFVIAIGNNDVRKRIHDEFASLPWIQLVHPDTTIGDSSLRSLSQRRGA